MPRDTDKAEPAEVVRFPMTLAELLAEDDAPEAHVVPTLGTLPPLSTEVAIPRSPRNLPVPDLSAFSRVWTFIGEGNTGKTTTARWMADQIVVRGLQAVLATVAPSNRALDRFAAGVMQPDTADPRATAAWQLRVLQGMARKRLGGLIDGGGGDVSTGQLIRSNPDLAAELEEQGLGLVAGYFFGPRVDDVTFLNTYEAMGFRPRATALVLNLARAETPSAFDDVRRQPAYRAALDRGAVELWLPAMSQETALAIERASLRFSEVGSLKLYQRSEVARWLNAMRREFSTVETWLPWT